ncbi:MAG: hypothetical protein WBH03_09500, partial [Cyclobacteriaceae bacterium]
IPELPDNFPAGTRVDAVTDWFTNPTQQPVIANTGDLLYPNDSTSLQYTGEGQNVPLNFMLYGVIARRFRIGGGFGLQYHSIKYLQSKNGGPPDYQTDITTLQTRWWGMAGYSFYQYWDYTFTADIRVGKINRRSEWNKSTLKQGLTFNAGITIDKHLSKYFRVFLRPSYDFGGYTALIPGGADIRHRAPTVFLEFGLSLNYPVMPRSPVKADHIQMEHVVNHPRTGEAMWVRGQPITKKQNPHVGENHPVLFKYKGKNKRKRNPY